MKTSDEIRWGNLLLLIAEAGSDEGLAERYGCSVPYIKQLKLKSKDSESGKPKGIGNATARKLEDCMSKQRGWLDQDHSGDAADSPDQQFADRVKEEVFARDVPEQYKQTILTLLTSSPEKKK